jgi:hypothetical protein
LCRSLALQDGLVEPNGQLFPANCSAYLQSGIIQPYQYDVCRNNSYLLSAIARGLRRAVAACQKTFKNGSWNCTAFQGAHLLGKAIETKESKEAAYVRTLISAAITFDIATACREKKIPDCPCASDFPFVSFENGTVSLGGCSDNYQYGVEVNKAFTEGEEDNDDRDLPTVVKKHNNELGRKIIDTTFVECKCHGQTGSCNVRICYNRLRGFKEASSRTFGGYSQAIQVNLMQVNDTQLNCTNVNDTQLNCTNVNDTQLNCTMVNSSHEIPPQPSSRPQLVSVVDGVEPSADAMVYSEQSPSYCEPIPEMNIIGTHDRQCDPGITGLGSCDVLCCGRGYYKKTKFMPDRHCTGVFDVETGKFGVKCIVMGYYKEVDHFCN